MEQSIRSACRGQVTRVVNAVTEFFAANQPPKDVDDLDVSAEEELLVLKERLCAAAEKLTEANAAIKADAKSDPAQLAKEREQEYDYEDKVIAAKARIEHRLSRYNLLQNLPNKLNLAENIKSEPQHIKLPKLELKKFDGELKNWLPFWEQFRSAVHANKALSASDKFNYLQTLLVGKAEKTIAGFTPTELCYNEAINLLQEQYGGEDRLIDQCMQELMNLQLVITKEDMHGLQRLYNTITTTTRSLHALGVNASQYNIILKPLILRSLPNELRVAYHRTQYKDTKAAESSVAGLNSTTVENSQLHDTHTSENNDKQVQTLIEFIRRELEAREKAIDGRRNLRTTATTSSKSVSNRQNTFTAAGLLTANVQVCLFCKSKCHSTANCDDKSVTIEKKKVILSKGGYCYRCAKPNHNSKQCRNSYIKCNKCNGRHASSMCNPNYKKNKNMNDVENDSAVKRSETSVNLFTVNKSLPLVHLQTACCFIRNPVKSDSVFIRLVLDSGSQATFIRESISRQLDLPVLGMRRMSILTFGSKQERPRLFKRVQLNLQGQYGNELIDIEAIEVPEICLDMLTPSNDCNINLKNLCLADTYPEWLTPESGISLLIGSDQYWRIVTGELEDITSSLKAVNTRLGWTLQGPVSNDDINVTLSTAFSLLVSVQIDNEFDVRKFWDLETLGIRDINESMNLESQKFIENNVVEKMDVIQYLFRGGIGASRSTKID